MFEGFPDGNGGYQIVMIPYYVEYFRGMFDMFNDLRETINQKWNE